jgi:hypothetical protein
MFTKMFTKKLMVKITINYLALAKVLFFKVTKILGLKKKNLYLGPDPEEENSRRIQQ